MAFLLLGCKLFVLDLSGDKVERTLVLKSDGSFIDVCLDRTIEVQGEYVVVFYKSVPFGAGGGNNGGFYRSKDGFKWEKHNGDKWWPKE